MYICRCILRPEYTYIYRFSEALARTYKIHKLFFLVGTFEVLPPPPHSKKLATLLGKGGGRRLGLRIKVRVRIRVGVRPWVIAAHFCVWKNTWGEIDHYV